ncbi:hypothetical protein ACWER9_06705 [Micromonospora sp. NPDC003944]
MRDRSPQADRTALDLDAIETRALVATPGPWKHSIGTVRGINGIHEHVVADRPVDGFDVIAMTGRMDEHPRSVLERPYNDDQWGRGTGPTGLIVAVMVLLLIVPGVVWAVLL